MINEKVLSTRKKRWLKSVLLENLTGERPESGLAFDLECQESG